MSIFKTTRRTLLKLIGGLAVFRSARSGTADTFTLVPQLAEGQLSRYRLELKAVRDGVIAHRSRSIVTVEILQRVAEGWIARWITSGSELIEADPRMRPMLEAMHAIWDGIAIDLVLDEGGRVNGLADFAAVRDLGAKSLDRLVALLAADPARAPLAEPLRTAMQATLANGGMLAQSVLKEPAILLGAMGHDYGVGEPLEVRTKIPSPMGSGEIPIFGRYQVRGISSQDSRADFIVDTATAWPVSVHHVRRIAARSGSRVDTVELTRLEA